MLGSSDLCASCKQRKKEAIRAYVAQLREFGVDRYLSREEERSLTALQQQLGLDRDDLKEADREIENLRRLTKLADIAAYEQKLVAVSADQYLDQSEEQELENLQTRLALTQADIAHNSSELMRLRRFSAIADGRFPILEPDIILQKKEVCHYEIPSGLVEETTKTRYVGGSRGVSFRIAKGVYYRVGNFKGERVTERFKQMTDSGTLYVTNKRVIFVGAKKNITYPFNKIINITKFDDAIQFQKENETKPKYFLIKDQSAIDEIGLLVTRVASQD